MALAVSGCLPASVKPTEPPTPTPTPSPTPLPTPTPTPAPLPTPTPTPAPPTPTPAPTFALYKVKSGDTLTSIAKRYKTDARSIAYWNRAKYKSLDPESLRYRPDNIKVGWTLKIMRGETYAPPVDDGESGVQYTPPPDDLDPEDPSAGPSNSPSPSG